MSTATVDIVRIGARVRYHGSIREHRDAEMTVEGFHAPYEAIHEGDVIRYILWYGTGYGQCLSNVRPESFTVLKSETTTTH